ncbi:hypothetical protein BJY04DRAFT_224448 [Aspergillus karnatakaensis]|uniref:fungal specific transcription factor domain-containing protein n=1 Tax=Aspergillus karnatakaensis TaxID=1810916 RepID=UPI003CCE324F
MQRQASTYGQACVLCYKAKCRCVRSNGETNCDRCLRLKKRCQPSKSVRRRDVQRSEDSEARIAQLEGKIEILLSAMRPSTDTAASGPSANISQSFQTFTGDNVSSTSSSSNGTLDFSQGQNVSKSLHGNLILPSSLFSTIKVEERITFFKTRMLPCFPFIDLTPSVTSEYLRQNRPFLLHAIYTVTTFSTKERLVQVEGLKRVLFDAALLQVQSSIDLLLGTLVYLAWSTDAFLGRADLVSRLMMLAMSLVYDLRLFKPSSLDTQLMMSITQGGCDNGLETNDETSYGFLEKQRAVLACFILSSNVSSHLGRQDALRWTPQMDDALQALKITKACSADAVFVLQVRLQQLKQRAEQTRQQDETDYACAGAASAPRMLYLKTLQRELDEIRCSFPTDPQQIDILSLHAHYVKLYINQLGYTITRSAPPSHPFSSAKPTSDEIFPRLTTLWSSLTSIKSWLDTFYTLPPEKLPTLPFHFWSHMVLTITLLKYLSVLQDPDWDRDLARREVHLLEALDSLHMRLEMGSAEREVQGCEDHLLVFLGRLVGRCRVWGEKRWEFSDRGMAAGDEAEEDAIDPKVGAIRGASENPVKDTSSAGMQGI